LRDSDQISKRQENADRQPQQERAPSLVQLLRRQFRLDWRGVHGAPHWARVRINGLQLANLNGARRDVIELFAVLHDSQRHDDGYDPLHGARAAELAFRLNGQAFHLDPAGLELLVYACRYHSEGRIEGDITVSSCWDADRLDLGRVGVRPDPARLATAEARLPAVIEPAYRRSVHIGR
jgi:uncharacterized protein